MSAPQEQPADQQENTYVMDPESASEMARLVHQDQLITSGMGGLFPEPINLSGVERVLDLACGPGAWALDVAYTYSDIEVVGVDISERMIAYSNAQANVQQRSNVSFQVMDILQPLTFPENSFDLVNARLISSFMQRDKWPLLFQECLRILRPGGIMRLTEVEVGMSNKPHLEQAMQMGTRAVHRAGLSFSPSGTHYGIVQMLPYFFRQANLSILGQMAHFLEFSFGTTAHESFYQDLSMAFHLFEPLITKLQFATSEEWRELYQKGLAEMYEPDFCAGWTLLTVWGEKRASLQGERPFES